MPRLIFFYKARSKIEVTWSNVLVPKERSLHNASIYMKYQSTKIFGSKDIAQLKFFKTKSKFKIKVTRSKVLVTKERSPPNASICQVSKPEHNWFKRNSPG
jgi:hypothetical protein